ncbi:hypothetical protein H0O03_02715 [Candidatus Micrarchaeota archaeon]|nr:hypothetical protein [Candidatus Micrarchaeota archaeon]
MKGIFSTDVSIAFFLAMLTLATCLSAFWLSASNYSSSYKAALTEKTAVEAADFVLKNCFPEGAAKCSDSLAYSHVLDERAQTASFTLHSNRSVSVKVVGLKAARGNGFCVRRPALLDGEEVFVEACAEELR